MKNLKIIIILLIAFIPVVVGLMGCSILGEACDPVDPNAKHKFWVVNLNPGMFGQNYCEIGTEDPYEGSNVNVYMDYGKYDAEVVKKVADEFDMMYPIITEKFGKPVMNENNNYNNNGKKVTLLLFDIKDGYNPTTNPAYVGGYFYSVDYLTQESLESSGHSDKSNEQAIMYIDIYPQDVTKDDVYSTVAHEFQHMINFSENILEGGNTSATLDTLLDGGVPTWIDEGFAMSSERIWAEEVKKYDDISQWPVYARIEYFNSSSFLEGNPLIKWIREEQGYDVLSNYSTSFIFMQYLMVHHPSKSGIFKIMNDQTDNDIKMIDPIISALDFSVSNFDELFEKWMIANVVNNNSSTDKGLGYNDDKIMKDVKAVVGSESKQWGFYPGAFMYRKTATDPQLPSGMEYMRFGNNGENSSGDYIAVYNPDQNPKGDLVSANVPSGEKVKSKGYYKKAGPQRIDWLLKKPLSVTSDEELRLPQKRYAD